MIVHKWRNIGNHNPLSSYILMSKYHYNKILCIYILKFNTISKIYGFEPIVLHPCVVKKDEPNLFFLTSMATANAYICAKDTPNLS
jgi:hypothetical protein